MEGSFRGFTEDRASPPARSLFQWNHETVRVSLRRSDKIGKNWQFGKLNDPERPETGKARKFYLSRARTPENVRATRSQAEAAQAELDVA
jgi:hypothetical protein